MILLLSAILSVGALPDWVPARWISADSKSLALLDDTPINCLLIESDDPALAKAASERGVATLAEIRPGEGAAAAARKAISNGLTGVVLEGDFDPAAARALHDSLAGSKAAVIDMPPRRRLHAGSSVLATYQGVWPGIPVDDRGGAKAGPTGSPWVNTNLDRRPRLDRKPASSTTPTTPSRTSPSGCRAHTSRPAC